MPSPQLSMMRRHMCIILHSWERLRSQGQATCDVPVHSMHGSSLKRKTKQNLRVDTWLSNHRLSVMLATTTVSHRAES
eukprot:10409-Heterococcus_DN1.PRE.1